MKKIRPYRGVYKIPTHKHNKKRYRQSIYRTDTQYNYTTGSGDWVALVTDLQRVPKRGKQNPETYPIPDGYKLVISPDGYWRTKKLGIFKNLWQNKIKKLRRKNVQ